MTWPRVEHSPPVLNELWFSHSFVAIEWWTNDGMQRRSSKKVGEEGQDGGDDSEKIQCSHFSSRCLIFNWIRHYFTAIDYVFAMTEHNLLFVTVPGCLFTCLENEKRHPHWFFLIYRKGCCHFISLCVCVNEVQWEELPQQQLPYLPHNKHSTLVNRTQYINNKIRFI